MRKQIMRLLWLCICLLPALAGCGNAEPAEQAQEEVPLNEIMWQANGLLKNTDSYTADFRAAVKMEGAEEAVTNADIRFVAEPLSMEVDMKTEIGEVLQETQTYLMENGNQVDYYMNFNDQWTEMTMEKADAIKNMQIYHALENAITLLTFAQDWQIEAQEGDIAKVSAIIPEKRFYEVEKAAKFFQLAGMSGLSEEYFYGMGDTAVRFSVDLEEQKLNSYEIDLTDALEAVTNNVLLELNGGSMAEGIAVEYYTISATFDRLGDVEPGEIPAEARSSAINYEEEFYLMAAR